MKRVMAIVMVMAVMCAAMSASAQQVSHDVLKQVPESSQVVVIIPKLSDVNAKLGKFLAEFGLTEEGADTPMSKLLFESGMGRGVNMEGSAAIVMPTLQLLGEPRYYLLLPITDAVAFMGNFDSLTPSERTPNVMQTPWQGSLSGEGFVKMVDGYAVIGNNEQVVARQAAATDAMKLIDSAGALGQGVLQQSDVLVYVNMAQAGPTLQLMAMMGMAHAQLEMERDNQVAGRLGGSEVVRTFMQAAQQFVSTVLLQTQAVVIGGQVGDAGVTFHVATQFKADSMPATMFAKASDVTLDLNRLSDKPYFMAMSMDDSAIDWKPMITAAEDNLVGKLPEGHAMRPVVQSYIDVLKAMESFTFSQYALYMGDEANPMDMTNATYVFGAREPAQALEQYTQATRRWVDAFNTVQDQINLPVHMSYHAGEQEVEGRRVDRFTMQMDVPQDDMGMNPMGAMMSEPSNGYIVGTDDAVIIMQGKGTQRLADAIKAANGTGRLGAADEHLALTRRGLPAGRFAEGFVNVSAMMQMGVRFGAAMGFVDDQVQVPAMPPIGIAFTNKEGGVQMTQHVPMDLIRKIRDFAQAQRGAMMMGAAMMGGMGDGEVAFDGPMMEVERIAPAPAGVQAASDEQFDTLVLQQPHPAVVLVTAPWSASSRRQTAVFNEVAGDFEGKILFANLDLAQQTQTPEAYKVMAVPTVLIFRQGQLVKTITGVSAKSTLAAELQEQLAAQPQPQPQHQPPHHRPRQQYPHVPVPMDEDDGAGDMYDEGDGVIYRN